MLIAGGVAFCVQYGRVMSDVDTQLQEKAASLPAVADDASSLDYVARLVSGFLPVRNQAVLGIIDGEVRAEPVAGAEFAADDAPSIAATATDAVSAASGIALGTVQTADGPVRFIAVPVSVPGDTSTAIYLRMIGLDAVLAPLRSSILTYIVTALVVLAALGAVGWLGTGRLLHPLRRIQEAADSVTLRDLGARVPETGDDEIAQLSRTMNSMLERLETSIGGERQLLDDIRHELKTPITIVRGHLEMMDVNDPADVANTREIGISELDRMTRLVADIELLSAAQDDQLVMHPIEVSTLTDRVGELVAALPGHLFSTAHRGHGTLVGDADRLTQAWLQLADNASKYTPEGSPIEIGSDVTESEVLLWVRDHGPGIPPAARHRIFRRFDRANVHRTVGGSGLGLAIVDAIAKAHAGSCLVTETPGGGATFTVRVPVGPHPDAPVPTPVRAGDVVLQREATT